MTRVSFKHTLEDILEAPRGTLQDSDNRDTVAGWTSLADVQILSTITSEFGLEPEADLLEAETVGELLGVLDAHHVFDR